MTVRRLISSRGVTTRWGFSNNGRCLSLSEKAARIREACKAKGWNQRQVTVRVKDSTLHVTIRSTAIRISEVREIAEGYETVHRDEFSGEILCGGNTFVGVEYSAEITEAAEGALAFRIPVDGTIAKVGGFEVFKDSHDYFVIRGAGRHGMDLRCWGRSHTAREIAVRMLDRAAA